MDDLDLTLRMIMERLELEDVNPGVYHGQWKGSGAIVESHSPIDGRRLAAVRGATENDYAEVMDTAEASYRVWSSVPAPERGMIVKEVADELVRHKTPLGRLVSLEVGKTLTEGEGEIQEMIDIGYYAVGLSRQLFGLTMASERRDHRMYEQWQPVGPVGVVTSFNFPAAVWSWNALIAAVVGDVIVWKPSSKAPLTAVAITRVVNRVFERRGLPPVFLLAVGGGRDVGQWMIEDGRFPLISFTGSVGTGREVSSTVGNRLGRSLLELGGNNAAIVTGKCDMEMALKGVAFGALATAGQRCTSTRRLILHDSVYEEFLSRLVKVYREVKVGDPLDPGTLVGPLIDEGAVEDFLNAIESAEAEGGRLLCGGERMEVPGHYVRPAIIEASPDMEMVSVETFAPILYVMRYSTTDEALEIHNSVPQGLSSAIFTSDLREEEAFLSHSGSDCGIANVNTSTAGAEIGGAFGGEKDTGGGRESGSDAWKVYARRQTVTINHGDDLPLSQGVRFDV